MKLNTKRLAIIAVSLMILGVAVLAVMNGRDSKSRKQWFDREFNQIPENPNSEDIIGLSLANLSVDEEKEIQEIIKKAFEGQWLYRYHYKNEDEMDELIRYLYLPEGYQQFKKEIKEKYKYIGRENSLKGVSSSLEKMRFSKPRKYKDLDDRIGIIAGSEFGDVHYFLFKKVDNQWKIEKEKWPSVKYYFDETSIIKELVGKENNEMSKTEIGLIS